MAASCFVASEGGTRCPPGKDAGRALAKMTKNQEDIVASLKGLFEKEIGVLAEWEKKFEDIRVVGFLLLQHKWNYSEQSCGALSVLCMAAKSFTAVLGSHLQDINDIGFRRWAKVEPLLARMACIALQRLSEDDRKKLEAGFLVFWRV